MYPRIFLQEGMLSVRREDTNCAHPRALAHLVHFLAGGQVLGLDCGGDGGAQDRVGGAAVAAGLRRPLLAAAAGGLAFRHCTPEHQGRAGVDGLGQEQGWRGPQLPTTHPPPALLAGGPLAKFLTQRPRPSPTPQINFEIGKACKDCIRGAVATKDLEPHDLIVRVPFDIGIRFTPDLYSAVRPIGACQPAQGQAGSSRGAPLPNAPAGQGGSPRARAAACSTQGHPPSLRRRSALVLLAPAGECVQAAGDDARQPQLQRDLGPPAGHAARAGRGHHRGDAGRGRAGGAAAGGHGGCGLGTTGGRAVGRVGGRLGAWVGGWVGELQF